MKTFEFTEEQIELLRFSIEITINAHKEEVNKHKDSSAIAKILMNQIGCYKTLLNYINS
jgi:hypothetical protein